MQGDRTAEEHVQDFEKAALKAGYEEFPLIVEFKRSIHPALQKHLSEIRPQPITIQEWYNEAIMINRQWRITKAEEAFYGKVNQGRSNRKPPSNQTGTPGVWNDFRTSYNNYGQGGYQNQSQQSELVMVLHQDYTVNQDKETTNQMLQMSEDGAHDERLQSPIQY